MTNSINILKTTLQAATLQSQPTPPMLLVSAVKGGVNVSWPASAAGYTLYSAPVGENPMQWTEVPTNGYQTNGAVVTFPVDTSSGSFVFRLRHP
jgi:hypothetical protein